MAERWTFPSGIVYEAWPSQRLCRSTFARGVHLFAAPQDGPGYLEQARALGYGGDDAEAAWAMCREHDLLHHVLASLEGKVSATLRAMAIGGGPHEQWREEEARVLELQTCLNKLRTRP